MISLGNTIRFASGFNSCRALLNSYKQNLPLYNSCAGAKTLEEQVGLPPKPKKPLTPYFRFMREVRPTILAENPQASTLDVVKIIAKKWETVDEAKKKQFQDEFKKDQKTYIERRAKYDNKITPEKKSEMKQLKQEIAESKEKREVKKRVKELGRPKRPVSAFLRFLVKERTLTGKDTNQTYKEWHTKATEKWTRLSDAEKDIYFQESRKDMEKYKQELSKWEEKMIRLGHIDVVRNESLIDPQTPKARRKTIKTE